jgi:hypothetical protein
MISRNMPDRIEALEAQLLPPPRARSFSIVIDGRSPLSQGEQIEAFKTEKGVGPFDHLVILTFQ